MSKLSQDRRDILLLGLLSLLVNSAIAALISEPGYLDPAYYFERGVALVEGRGWVQPYIWNYVAAPEALPVPAFDYWQPFAAFLAAAGIVAFGRLWVTFAAAQVPFILLAALLPVISYLVGRTLGERRHGWLAGLLTVFSGIYAIYWSLPETFTPFAVSGAAALALAGWARAEGRWWRWLAAGVCAGLAHLTRADGLLLLSVLGLMSLLPSGGEHSLAHRLRSALVVVAGYLLIMAPWFDRNLSTFGSMQAPGGLSTLWLVEYNDIFTYPPRLSPRHLFAAGWGQILRTRLAVLGVNLATFMAVHNMVFLTPLTLIGGWKRRHEARLLPAYLYGGLLFMAMTFAFALVGRNGGWLHSGAALLPFVMALAVLGLDDAVWWVAQRRRTWRVVQARRVFGVAAVLLAVLVTAFAIITRVVGAADLTTVVWGGQQEQYIQVGAALDAAGASPTVRVMSNNTPGVYLYTGRGGIPLVNGDEADVLRAADDYGVTYLLVDRHVPAGLESFYSDGPTSPRFEEVTRIGSPSNPLILYRILSK